MATYDGTSGNDYYSYPGSEKLTAYGNKGDDTIVGNTNNDIIHGNNGNDLLYGLSGNDTLYGEGGSDTLLGGRGDDWLYGSNNPYAYSSQYDVLNGGDGSDTFVLGERQVFANYYQGGGHAIIQDYNSAYDYIQLKGSASSYRLDKTRNSVGGAGNDTRILDSENDLLAIVQDTTDLQLTSYYFKFV